MLGLNSKFYVADIGSGLIKSQALPSVPRAMQSVHNFGLNHFVVFGGVVEPFNTAVDLFEVYRVNSSATGGTTVGLVQQIRVKHPSLSTPSNLTRAGFASAIVGSR
jgi:hypothetical protein